MEIGEDKINEVKIVAAELADKRFQDLMSLYRYTPLPRFREISHLPLPEHYYLEEAIRRVYAPEIKPEDAVLPTGVSAEVTGFPTAGKTSLLAKLATGYSEATLVDDEERTFLTKRMIRNLNDASRSNQELRNILMSGGKLYTHHQVDLLHRQFGMLREDWDGPEPPLFKVRGLIDTLSFGYWFHRASSFRDHETDNFMNWMVREAIFYMRDVDFVVLYYLDYEEAQRRRIAQGLEPTGRIVNETVWPIMDFSYRWLQHVLLMYLRKEVGTGILILDGNQPEEVNNQKVIDFTHQAELQKIEIMRAAGW